MAKALVVVDEQNDFTEDGSLPVTGGSDVCIRTNSFIQSRNDEYDEIVFTQDWHLDPGTHWISKANPVIDYKNVWPIHCAAGTWGCEFHASINKPNHAAIFRKGAYQAAYSGFEGQHWITGTPLLEWLRLKEINELDICGLATDYCVLATALDAIDNKFEVHLITDLIAAVHPVTGQEAIQKMVDNGVKLVESQSA